MEAIFTTTGMQIKPYRPSKAKIILMARSVWVKGSHAPKPVTAYVMQDPNGKRLCTYKCHPTWLEEVIPDIVISYMTPNHKEELGQSFSLNPDIIPNETQISVAQTILNNNFKVAFFNLPTGIGKTLGSIYLMSILNTKGWLMCYRTIVLEQWRDTLENATTFDTSRVCIIHEGKQLMKMAMGDWPFEKYDFYLSTPKILTMFAEREGMDLLNDVFNNAGIGVKFYDEASSNVGNIVKINALTNVERTYYLSADFGQAAPAQSKLYHKMFASTPVIRLNDEIIKSMMYTVAILTRYNTNPSFSDVESVFGQYGFSRQRYMEYQLKEDMFYHALSSTLMAIHKSDPTSHYKTLILCTLIEHVNNLLTWVTQFYKKELRDKHTKVVRYHSDMPKEEREEALKTGQVIVSTFQSMGIGVDIKLIRNVIDLVPVNPIEDNQAAGRARALPNGENVFYHMFIDDGFEYVKMRLPDRLTYLQEQKLKDIYSIKYS